MKIELTSPNLTLQVSNGHSPQIRENGELLVRMCRGESNFSRKWPLVSVDESAQHGPANVGESGESPQHGLANVGESGESDTFPKKAILASTNLT